MKNTLKVYNAIRDRTDLDVYEKGILYHVCGRGDCWESQRKIADHVGCSQKAVQTRLPSMVERGLLIESERGIKLGPEVIPAESNVIPQESKRFPQNQIDSPGITVIPQESPSKEVTLRSHIKKPNKRGGGGEYVTGLPPAETLLFHDLAETIAVLRKNCSTAGNLNRYAGDLASRQDFNPALVQDFVAWFMGSEEHGWKGKPYPKQVDQHWDEFKEAHDRREAQRNAVPDWTGTPRAIFAARMGATAHD